MEGSTLKQIAQELGLSVSTVSRAINGKTVIKEETRKRVMELAEKYSYTPNEIARALQKSATNTIAVALPDISEAFFGTIVNEIDRVVSAEGYTLILSDTHEEKIKEQKLLSMLYTRRVDALVLATVDVNGKTVEQFLKNKTPVIFIDNVPHLNNIDAITIDNFKASYMAVEYLLKRSHKDIAVIVGSQEETTGYERLKGYKSALTDNNCSVNEALIAYGDFKQESGYNAMKKLLENTKEHPFSAVYVTSEKMTYGAIKAIRENGLSVPNDISVIGFDIHTTDDGWRQRITSIRQPEEEIGTMVGNLLLARLKNKEDISYSHISLDPIIEEGDTVK